MKNPTYRFEKMVEEQFGQSKLSFWIFMILRIIVLGVLVISIIRGRYENIVMCIITLVLFTLPPIFERTLNADFPTYFEVTILLFVFSAQMLGELACFYIKYPFWDTMLHTISGFIFAAFGFSLVDLLNKDQTFKFKLSPTYMGITSFGFAMTVGVIWEFFEWTMDTFFGKDMQKDRIVHSFQSVMLDPTNSNIPVKVSDIHTVTIDGYALPFDGYLDIGLYDTMKDLAVCAIGALVFSILAFFYVKTGGKSKLLEMFIPVKRNWKENPPDRLDAELAERKAKFERELEERNAKFEAEMEEKKNKFDKEMEEQRKNNDK